MPQIQPIRDWNYASGILTVEVDPLLPVTQVVMAITIEGYGDYDHSQMPDPDGVFRFTIPVNDPDVRGAGTIRAVVNGVPAEPIIIVLP